MQTNLAVDLQRLERTLLKASGEQQRRGSLVQDAGNFLAPSIERTRAPARDDGDDADHAPPPLRRQASAPASEMAPRRAWDDDTQATGPRSHQATATT